MTQADKNEHWWDREAWSGLLVRYAVVLQVFVDERVSAGEFEILFLSIFSGEGRSLPEPIYESLNQLFYQLDDYCGDPELREEVGGIGNEELLIAAKRCLLELRAFNFKDV